MSLSALAQLDKASWQRWDVPTPRAVRQPKMPNSLENEMNDLIPSSKVWKRKDINHSRVNFWTDINLTNNIASFKQTSSNLRQSNTNAHRANSGMFNELSHNHQTIKQTLVLAIEATTSKTHCKWTRHFSNIIYINSSRASKTLLTRNSSTKENDVLAIPSWPVCCDRLVNATGVASYLNTISLVRWANSGPGAAPTAIHAKDICKTTN